MLRQQRKAREQEIMKRNESSIAAARTNFAAMARKL
jgi:hypothetical protein